MENMSAELFYEYPAVGVRLPPRLEDIMMRKVFDVDGSRAPVPDYVETDIALPEHLNSKSNKKLLRLYKKVAALINICLRIVNVVFSEDKTATLADVLAIQGNLAAIRGHAETAGLLLEASNAPFLIPEAHREVLSFPPGPHEHWPFPLFPEEVTEVPVVPAPEPREEAVPALEVPISAPEVAIIIAPEGHEEAPTVAEVPGGRHLRCWCWCNLIGTAAAAAAVVACFIASLHGSRCRLLDWWFSTWSP